MQVLGMSRWHSYRAASGYKKPEVPDVLACGTASARPFVGYSEGVLLTEHAGTEALGLLWVVHSVRGRAANWGVAQAAVF